MEFRRLATAATAESDAAEIDEDIAEALAAALAARAARGRESFSGNDQPHGKRLPENDSRPLPYNAEAAARAAGSDEDPYNPANDLERLSVLSLGEFPTLGEPIDPSDRGPLGKLWNGAAPLWCIRQRTLW